ncbi:MAG: OmpA family protein, partial [Candidatus Rokuibacteriota bacterium]
MLSRCTNVTITSLLLLGVLLAGCAKQPATSAATAPAPTGAATTTPGGAGPATAQSTTAAPPSGGTGAGAPATTPAPATAAPVARPAPQEFRADAALKDVYFDFDKYDIRPVDAKSLDSNATWLKSNANHLILIEGHCDERGTNEYNLALGERRANTVKRYMVDMGVPSSRLSTVSFGESRPAVQGHDESAWK